MTRFSDIPAENEAYERLEAAFDTPTPVPDVDLITADALLGALDAIVVERARREVQIQHAIDAAAASLGRVESYALQRLAYDQTATTGLRGLRYHLAEIADTFTPDELLGLHALLQRFAFGDESAAIEGMSLVVVGRTRRGEYTMDAGAAIVATMRLAVASKQRLTKAMAAAIERAGVDRQVEVVDFDAVQRASFDVEETSRAGQQLAEVIRKLTPVEAAKLRRTLERALDADDVTGAVQTIDSVVATHAG